jgi:hypothetical protein
VNRPRPFNGNLARLVLACVAALQILQAYPVAGSQVAFGTFTIVPAAIVCIGDGLSWLLAQQTAASSTVGMPRSRLFTLATTSLFGWAVAVAGSCLTASYDRYARHVPLGLPGAKWLRLPESRSVVYRELAKTIGSTSDAFLSTSGFNSLYVWTGVRPPNRVMIGNELSVFTDDEQVQMVQSLLKYERPMVVHDHENGPSDTKPLMRELERMYLPWRQIGPNTLFVPKPKDPR